MTRLRTLSTSVAWMPWDGAAFERARAEAKPVLLSLTAEWCGACREMDRTSYADPSIATEINERFVPVRVDADRHPDIGERYTLGGWPTTGFLRPDGAILGGGTFIAHDRMPSVLAQVRAAFGAHGGEQGAGADAASSFETPEAPPKDPGDLAASVFETFDPECGGFGQAAKFPLDAPLRLALDLWSATGEERYRSIAATSLDAMAYGGLYDEAAGGFFRCCGSRDWQRPRSEKLLQPNAALVRLYLEAGTALEAARFTERAADVLRYVQAWLADPVDGGWFASQCADDAYYQAPPAERRAMPAPAVSRLLLAEPNAAMAGAALAAAAVFEDDGLRDFALKSLERVLLACYKPGDGVARYNDGHRRARGLLADQVAMAAACLHAHEVTGNIVYEMMAEELMHFAARTMWNEPEGGFHDRAGRDDDVGLMRRPLRPFVTNCDAAVVLLDLADASGDQTFAALADRTLDAMAPLARAQGPLAAHYLLALRRRARR